MRIIKITIIFCLIFTGLNGQEANKIESYKIGFFTEKLELTPDESKSFWPSYNAFKKDIRKIKQDRRSRPGQMGLLSDAEIEDLIEGFLSSQEDEVARTRTFYTELKTFLPLRKAAMVFFVEREFNTKLLQTMRKDRRN